MDTEIKKADFLPSEISAKRATEFVAKALDLLWKNEGLKTALIKRFLENPDGLGYGYKPGSITFKSKGKEYRLNLTRNVGIDEIDLSTVVKRVQEGVRISIRYKEEREGVCTAFGGIKRGSVKEATIGYVKFSWRDSSTSRETHINDSQATEKVSDFLQRI